MLNKNPFKLLLEIAIAFGDEREISYYGKLKRKWTICKILEPVPETEIDYFE